MSRVAQKAAAAPARAFASALVAFAGLTAVALPSTAADDTGAVTSPVVDERAAQINAATSLETALAASSPAAPKKAVANFTARSQAAIRATRSASMFRWGTAAYAKWYAKSHIAQKYRWNSSQYGCLVSLWNKESHWRFRAINRGGHTYGIPQTTTHTITGFGTTFNTYMVTPELQVQVGAKYINYRYGSPCKAWSHSKRHGWY